ncbi:MAG: cell envelope integrity protein CreD [Planctomycetota bacterium]|nr:cell envelope integrity protein CreD [Planctomycetota bacterium]
MFKMAGVALLILLLLAPLAMIRSVLQERLGRRNEAVANITSGWGGDQTIIGPVLIVPYRYAVRTWKEQAAAGGKIERVEVVGSAVANAYFLPAAMKIDGALDPAELHRGIYRAVVYSAKLDLQGEFARPDFSSQRIEDKDILWEEALVAFTIPDLRGVKEMLQLEWGEQRFPLLPGSKLRGYSAGVFARVPGLRESRGAIPWKLGLTLRGSGGLAFAPVGIQCSVKLASPWSNPSFRGAFLPSERNITHDGFTANWQVSYYGRNYAQQWTDQDNSGALTPDSVQSSVFGVSLVSGIDAYRNVERAIKYGVLFLVLVFTSFFLFEVLSALRIHPFQYAIVGAALCLFYLGLLSLSEFIAFGLAYLVAAGVTMLLICFYSAKVLKSGRRTFIIAGLLAAIYGFLYVSLQLQDYSLLFGTAGLFVVLGIVIFITRNIDWYTRDQA